MVFSKPLKLQDKMPQKKNNGLQSSPLFRHFSRKNMLCFSNNCEFLSWCNVIWNFCYYFLKIIYRFILLDLALDYAVFCMDVFFGFFVVYRLGKDIVVDFLVFQIGQTAVLITRYVVPILIMIIMGFILKEMPIILSSQVGVIDGVVTPWGGELERYTLSIPLGISCFLIFS